MRSQVIDMVGYAGDITTAKDRIGIDSALIMIKVEQAELLLKS